ncbi:MAG TPA: histidine kinase [Chitinophagaceae bacterium]
MRRILLHILFWIVYLIQDTILAYSWHGLKLGNLPTNEKVFMAIFHCLVILVPKLFFTYFILYVILPKILAGRGRLWACIGLGVLAFAFTLVFQRLLIKYLVYPVIYDGLIGNSDMLNITNILVSIMDIGFVAGAAVFIKQLRLQITGKENEKALLKEKLETELKFLKNQTNPHFLFNTLNNIYALARKKSDKTADVVMKLSSMLRFMLHESGRKFITIAEEIKLIQDYLDLEQIRYNERLNICFKKEVDNENQHVSPLLLLPFVENAFKHGVSETRFNSFVNIDLKLNINKLYFQVSNSKETAGGQKNEGNIGLCNVKRQLELMYQDFDLKVENNDTTFTITLKVNLDSYEKL